MFSRRQLFRVASLFGVGSVLSPPRGSAAPSFVSTPSVGAQAQAASGALTTEPNVYKSIGVRPLINCRGTLTIIGGSIELPEVRSAKNAANQQHVHLDELMEAVGKRLAELTGAEWGMVSAGCAAAMSHATAACVAGGNPDLHVRIPNLAGFARDEVIIPTHSRNVYDAAIRAVGVKIIEVDTPEALQLAIGPKTAMLYIFAGPRNDTGPMSTEAIANIAKAQQIPVLVDAAAEVLTIPNIHLQRGATLVAYSGGKYIRGPQSAGLLLGRKDLVKAAWLHSAPHHGYARSMKIGREEIVGMLVAVESWVTRDHNAEWKQWVARCDFIAGRVSAIPGVSATVQREAGASLSNRSPRVTIRWDSRRLGITGPEVADLLDKGEPRIVLGGSGGGGQGTDGQGDTGISITSAMMSTGDEKIVAERILHILSGKHSLKTVDAPAAPVTNLSGRWTVQIQFTASSTIHTLHIVQNGNRLEGTHQGDFLARDISGTINGDIVSLTSNVTERHGDALTYRFSGKVTPRQSSGQAPRPSSGEAPRLSSGEAGEMISGSIDMGEYLAAMWTASRG